MAIDTAIKRASALNVGVPAGRTLPIPSGTIGVVGRQFMALCYVGIAAGTPPVFNPIWAENTTQLIGPSAGQPVMT